MITEIVSFDSHTFLPDYEVGFVVASEPRLPGAQIALLERIGAWPVIVALQRKPHRLALLIRIVGSDRHALRSQLFRWFDPEDETPKVLAAENHDGIAMYVYALCEDLRVYGDQQHDTVFVATLAVDGDVRWRSVTPNSDSWAITATADTNVITNDGEDEAYPIITLSPTSGKTGGYDYRKWVPVVWRSRNAGQQYSCMATLDTDALNTAGKMQADLDDLRVLVDGSEAYRWCDPDGADDPATKIWWFMDFTRAPDLELDVAIAGAGVIASIQVDDEVELALMPESGIVLIGSEAFVYTGRNLTDKQLTGVTREAKGTTIAAHNIGDAVHWIQHDVYILYGNAAATAPVVDDAYKPMFELDLSDNETWVYEVFGDSGNHRAGRWGGAEPIEQYGSRSGRYTGTEEITPTDPYEVAGSFIAYDNFPAGWYLENPCGIVNAAWADGKMRAAVVDDWLVHLGYWLRTSTWWSWQATLADPAIAWTWEAWSAAAAVADWAPADAISIKIYLYVGAVEVGTVTVSLYADEVPLVTVGPEQGNYELSGTITNQATGDAITVTFVMDLDTELEVNTDERTATWLEDDSGQFQAVSLSTARRHWLRLLPGDNTFRFDDVGTGNVTSVTGFEERYY